MIIIEFSLFCNFNELRSSLGEAIQMTSPFLFCIFHLPKKQNRYFDQRLYTNTPFTHATHTYLSTQLPEDTRLKDILL